MRTLITGADGFIGTVLAEALKDLGHAVFGLSQTGGGPHSAPVRASHFALGATRDRSRGWQGTDSTFLQADVTDKASVVRAVAAVRPDAVFHLAAQSDISRSFKDLKGTMEVNVFGSLHLFEAVRAVNKAATIVSVGSSAEYGLGGKDQDRIREDTPLLPRSPYGVSKAAQGMLALLHARTDAMRIMHVRPFMVIGPRKQGNSVAGWCQAITRIEAGENLPVTIGDPEIVRDFLDVRDCVAALLLVANAGKTGEVYNICNGVATRLGQVLDLLQSCATVPFRREGKHPSPRPADDRRLVGDPTRLEVLGYRPLVPLIDTLRATLAYWRTHKAEPLRAAADTPAALKTS